MPANIWPTHGTTLPRCQWRSCWNSVEIFVHHKPKTKLWGIITQQQYGKTLLVCIFAGTAEKQKTPRTICIHTLSHLSHTQNNNSPAMQREPGCAGLYLLCRCVWTIECSMQVVPLKSSKPCDKTYLMSLPSAALRGRWWCAVIPCTCTHAHFGSYYPCRVTCTSLMN